MSSAKDLIDKSRITALDAMTDENIRLGLMLGEITTHEVVIARNSHQPHNVIKALKLSSKIGLSLCAAGGAVMGFPAFMKTASVFGGDTNQKSAPWLDALAYYPLLFAGGLCAMAGAGLLAFGSIAAVLGFMREKRQYRRFNKILDRIHHPEP